MSVSSSAVCLLAQPQGQASLRNVLPCMNSWCALLCPQLAPGAALPVSADLARSAPVTRLLLEEVIYQLLLLVKTGPPCFILIDFCATLDCFLPCD